MRVAPTELPGVLLIEPRLHRDERGYFAETFRIDRFAEQGLPGGFVQDNLCESRHGVLRGLHYQHPRSQGKLVQVLLGEVFDVAVDVRRGSPTFGRWVGVALTGDNPRQLYVPPGFAHGYCVTSDRALVAYKCTQAYEPSADRAIRWDDPDLAIDWPLAMPRLSARDAAALCLRQVPDECLPGLEPTAAAVGRAA
jgi:dTDP-4-dehydrorhamnose 3,5-epimerase